MADHAAGHAAHGDDHVHHYDYPKIWAILLVLLVVSVVGPFLEIPIVTLITAFGVALVKAYIVARYFMHLNVQKPFVHYFMATSLAFMVLFFAGTAPDVRNHEGTNWENLAAKAEIERALSEIEAGGGHHGGGSHDDGGHGASQPAESGGAHH